MIVTVAPLLAAQRDPVLAEEPRGKPLQLESGQAMRLALERKSVERFRKDRQRAGGYQTLSPAHHECPGGIPHVQGIVCNSTNTQALTIEDLPISQDPTCLRPGSLGCPSSTVTAQLTNADCPLDDGSYYDVFRFSGTEGQTLTILMSSGAFDTFLFLQNPAGDIVASDDDSGGSTNSRLVFTLPTTGAWTVLANSFSASEFGPYILSLNCEGGIGPTATPLGAPPPTDIPTLSFPALLILMVLLTGTGFLFLRRG